MRRAEIPVDWDGMHQRLEAKLLPGPPSPDEHVCPGPCWAWNGAYSKQTGYAMVSVRRADGQWCPTTVHRVMWRLYRGEFDLSLELDHLCRNRSCVNPWHAEPVTHRINVLRGQSPGALAVRENRCRRGHEFTEENTVRRADGGRDCRECIRLRNGTRERSPRLPKTHCPHGHEFTEENTYPSADGKRRCITCARARAKEWRKQRLALPG